MSTGGDQMSDLFNSYKEEVRLNLKRKVPFGEHQRKAFQTIVDAKIERLKAIIARADTALTDSHHKCCELNCSTCNLLKDLETVK